MFYPSEGVCDRIVTRLQHVVVAAVNTLYNSSFISHSQCFYFLIDHNKTTFITFDLITHDFRLPILSPFQYQEYTLCNEPNF